MIIPNSEWEIFDVAPQCAGELKSSNSDLPCFATFCYGLDTIVSNLRLRCKAASYSMRPMAIHFYMLFICTGFHGVKKVQCTCLYILVCVYIYISTYKIIVTAHVTSS